MMNKITELAEKHRQEFQTLISDLDKVSMQDFEAGIACALYILTLNVDSNIDIFKDPAMALSLVKDWPNLIKRFVEYSYSIGDLNE